MTDNTRNWLDAILRVLFLIYWGIACGHVAIKEGMPALIYYIGLGVALWLVVIVVTLLFGYFYDKYRP